MPRYFFHISSGKPHRDEMGEDLRDGAEAWLQAKRLTRDIEDTLEPNGHWKVEVTDKHGLLQYRIKIVAKKFR